MPLIHVSMRTGRSAATRDAICDSIHRALHETFDVPDDNEFIAITEHEAANFRYSESYLGIERSDDLVMIQVTANDTRTLAPGEATRPTIEMLVRHVTCELYSAMNYPGNSAVWARLVEENFVTVIQLRLDVTDSGSFSPNLSFVHPLSAPVGSRSPTTSPTRGTR